MQANSQLSVCRYRYPIHDIRHSQEIGRVIHQFRNCGATGVLERAKKIVKSGKERRFAHSSRRFAHSSRRFAHSSPRFERQSAVLDQRVHVPYLGQCDVDSVHRSTRRCPPSGPTKWDATSGHLWLLPGFLGRGRVPVRRRCLASSGPEQTTDNADSADKKRWELTREAKSKRLARLCPFYQCYPSDPWSLFALELGLSLGRRARDAHRAVEPPLFAAVPASGLNDVGRNQWVSLGFTGVSLQGGAG